MEDPITNKDILADGYSLFQWQSRARRDDVLDRMVPSDLRLILSRIKDDAQTIAELRSCLAAAMEHVEDSGMFMMDQEEGHWMRKASDLMTGDERP